MSNVETESTLNTPWSKSDVVTWVKTMRLQTALVTSLTLWAGYVSVSPLDIRSAFLIGAIGIAYHIFGFTLNEVKDREYDAAIGNGSKHPIANGEVSPIVAKKLAWSSYAAAILLSLISGFNAVGTAVLALSAIPAYAYNKYSKTHWWSNIYLSTWASMMVIVGSLYAGTPTNITWVVVGIIAIQIFVQVMEGDLKDLTGAESSVCRTLGVSVAATHKYVDNQTDIDIPSRDPVIGENTVVTYTNKFVLLVYAIKFTQLGLLMSIPYSIWQDGTMFSALYTVMFFLSVIIFITSLSAFMVLVYDREKIKKYSSIHELTNIALIGLALYPLHEYSGVLIIVAPITWFIITNKLIHSGSLNPDV